MAFVYFEKCQGALIFGWSGQYLRLKLLLLTLDGAFWALEQLLLFLAVNKAVARHLLLTVKTSLQSTISSISKIKWKLCLVSLMGCKRQETVGYKYGSIEDITFWG